MSNQPEGFTRDSKPHPNYMKAEDTKPKYQRLVDPVMLNLLNILERKGILNRDDIVKITQ